VYVFLLPNKNQSLNQVYIIVLYILFGLLRYPQSKWKFPIHSKTFSFSKKHSLLSTGLFQERIC